MMSEKEFNKILFPDGRWFSPSWIIDTFNHYINAAEQETKDAAKALEKIVTHRNLKKLREMWAAAVFLLGYDVLTRRQHWLQPVIGDTTPDVLGVCFIQNQRFKDSHTQAQIYIEISEWDKHANSGLAQRIKEKLNGMCYPDYYHLIIHVTRLGDVSTNLDEVSAELGRANFNIAGIWIVAGTSKHNVKDNYTVVQLFPAKLKKEFSLGKALKYDRAHKIPPLMLIDKRRGKDFHDFSVVETKIPSLS